MKKLLVPVTLITFSLALAACKPKPATDTLADLPTQEQTQQEVVSEANQIANAMQSGQSLKCTVTHNTDGSVMNYAVKGKLFKVDGMAVPVTSAGDAQEVGHAINDGTYLYSWSTPSNKGFKMTIPSEEELKAEAEKYQDMAPDFSRPEVMEEYENDYTIQCDPATLTEADFTPPSDVQFQDISAMMENAKTQMEQAQQGMTPEQKQMMEDALKQAGQGQ